VAGPSERTLTRLAAEISPDASSSVVAHHLVVRGVLTRFQADQLLAGKGGTLALGPYLLLEPNGEEDGGRVFRARHVVMDRLVGVWVADRPGRSPRLDAARQAARLAHPHILTVLDVNPDAERPYVVTEYVDGAGLETVTQVAGRLPVGRACDLVRQIALALAHAHERGVGHGRLTAESVRVGKPGGAGAAGQMTAKLAGFRGGPADADTVCNDLLALGRLATHLLAGRPDAPLPPGVPPAVAGLVAELTHANPYRRPGAAVAAERLAPFAELGDEIAPAGGEVCPFAELQAMQPTDVAAVTRAEPVGGKAMWVLAGVTAGVGLLTAGAVAAMM
jgi:hypothetical protein